MFAPQKDFQFGDWSLSRTSKLTCKRNRVREMWPTQGLISKRPLLALCSSSGDIRHCEYRRQKIIRKEAPHIIHQILIWRDSTAPRSLLWHHNTWRKGELLSFTEIGKSGNQIFGHRIKQTHGDKTSALTRNFYQASQHSGLRCHREGHFNHYCSLASLSHVPIKIKRLFKSTEPTLLVTLRMPTLRSYCRIQPK